MKSDFGINHSSSEKLYIQLKEGLESRIMSGEFKGGDRLPSIPEMSSMSGLSLQTVQNAINELKREGLVYSRLSKGIFVLPGAGKIRKKGVREELKDIYFISCNENYMPERCSRILQGIEEEAIPKGLNLIYRSLASPAHFACLKNKSSSGLIVAGDTTPQKFAFIRNLSMPFVLVGDVLLYEPVEKGTDIIAEDDSGAIYLATQCLLNSGHGKVAIITGPVKYFWARAEIKAYERAHGDMKLKWNELLKVETARTEVKDGYLAMKELFRDRSLDFSGLIICDEELTYGAIKYITEKKKSIPGGIKIVAKGSAKIFQVFGLNAGTIEACHEDMGRLAVRQLIKKYSSPAHAPSRIVLDSKFVVWKQFKRLTKSTS